MSTASLILLAALVAQPATRTTPTEILTTCYFNDAKVDATLLHHVVDVTSRVASVDRDGIGGYVVKLESQFQSAELTARSNVHCYFDGASRAALARIRLGREVTIRGVVRKIDDDLRRYVDPNVQVTMKGCELVGGAE
jgi:hypothetical protein